MAVQLKKPIGGCSDSQIALGWTLKGKVKDKKLLNQAQLATKANALLKESSSILQWVPRESNNAGHYLEEKYSI